jgi:hypothetical protein
MRVAELLELAKRPAAAPPIRAAAPAPSSGRIAVAAPAIAAAPASLPDEAPEGAGRRRTAWIAALALVPIVAGGVLFAAVKLRAPQPAPPAPPPVQGDTPVHPPPVQGADPPAPPPKIADAPAVENGAAERSLVERKHSHAGAKVARGQPAHVREAAAPIGLVDSPPPRREERAAPPADPLVQRIDSQARQMSPGARRVQLFRGEGPRTDWTVNLEANRCYTFVGTVEEGGLYLYLWGPAGRRLAAYHQRTQSGSLYHCAAFAGAYHVQAKLAGGIGSYRLGVYAR